MTSQIDYLIFGMLGHQTAVSRMRQVIVITAIVLSVVSSQQDIVTPISTTTSAAPIFYSMKPVKGPLEGNSPLEFYLFCPGHFSLQNVMIGNTTAKVNVINRTGSNLTVNMLTPPANLLIAEIAQPVYMLFNNNNNKQLKIDTEFNFTYYQHPVISYITPTEYIYTGGTRLTISGVGLDISLSPQLEVTTVSKLGPQMNRATYRSPCSDDVTSSLMTCILPTPLIPAKIIDYLDGVNNTKQLVDNGNVDDGNGNTMSIYVGLIFDGNVKYRNLTEQLGRNGTSVLTAGPTIRLDTTTLTVSRDDKNPKNVQGLWMTRGCSLVDYKAYLESRQCNVTDLTDTTLSIVLPSMKNLSSNPNQYQFTCNSDSYHLQVYVGYRQYDYQCVRGIPVCTNTSCYNGGKCIDNFDSFTCTCLSQFYGDHCESPYPVITDAFPTRGSIAGRTRVTLTASIPDKFSADRVYFGDSYSAPVISQSSSNVVVDTPSVSDVDSLPIIVQFQLLYDPFSYYNATVNEQFYFGLNPTVLDVSPLEQISSGGTTLTINGTSMDSVAFPYVTITALLTSSGIKDVETWFTLSFTSLACIVNSSTNILCPMPQLTIPDIFIDFLDNQSYTPFASFSSKPAGYVEDYVDDSLQCKSVHKTTTYPYPKDAKFSVVLLFDGTQLPYKKSELVLYPPPIICSNASQQTYSGADLLIKGVHLLRGVGVDDYKVQIENIPCIITLLTDNSLQFQPPSADLPQRINISTKEKCSGTFPYRLLVTVGGMAELFAGCVQYEVTQKNDSCLLPQYYCHEPNGSCIFGYITNMTRCNCTSRHFGNNCEFRKPVLVNLQPQHGALAGGTLVTIFGKISSQMTPVSASFGTWKTIDIVFSNSTCIVLKSPPGVIPNGNRTLTVEVTVSFNVSDQPWPVGATFTYIANPTIAQISPRDHITTGGTLLSITGVNLDAAVSPSLMISISTLTPNFNRVNKPLEGLSLFPTPNCSVISELLVECRMPSTEVLDQFIPLLDSKVADPNTIAAKRRRKRSLHDNKVITVRESVRSSSRWRRLSSRQRRRRRRDLSLVTQSGSRMTVHVVMYFDGFRINMSEVITNATLLLHNPPSVNIPDVVIPFYPNHSQIVEIQGDNLALGSNWTTDGSVFIGGVPCSILDVTMSRIHFQPPDLRVSGMLDLDQLRQNVSMACKTTTVDSSVQATSAKLGTIFPLEVQIGFGVFPAGCIRYVSTASENIRQRLNYVVCVWNVLAVFILRFILPR